MFSELLIFALGREPEAEGDGERRQCHDGEGGPVQDVGGELAVVVLVRDDGALSGGTADGVLGL